MALNKCCCCVNLRTGAIVIAILGILGSFGQLHDKEHIYIGIISDVIGVLANLFLLHGAIKYNKTTTLVYLIFEAIFIIGYIVGMCLVIAALVDNCTFFDSSLVSKSGILIGIFFLPIFPNFPKTEFELGLTKIKCYA